MEITLRPKSRPRNAARDSDERGMVLVVLLFLILVLGGLSVGLLTEGLAEKSAIAMRHSDLVALQICEKGIVHAAMEIYALKDSGTDGIGHVSGEYAGGTYEVTAVQDPGNADRWIMHAQGIHALSKRRVETGVRRRADSDFVEGLFAKDTVTFNGLTQTDAYDSRLGSYVSQAVNNDAGGSYASGGGHVGSNADIILHGSSVAIRGNAIPGPLHMTSLSGGPTVWGDTLPRRREIKLPPATLAEFQEALANNDNDQLLAGPPANSNGKGKGPPKAGPYDPNTYSLTGSGSDPIILKGGTYFFSNVSLGGQSTLQIQGPTTIYVTGDFDVTGGGIVNQSGVPGDLRVFVHPYALPAGHNPTASQVKVNGGSKVAMALYAPGAAVSVHGGNDVFGSYIGKTVVIAGNSNFHYDTALGDLVGHSSVTVERLYWRDMDEKLR